MRGLPLDRRNGNGEIGKAVPRTGPVGRGREAGPGMADPLAGGAGQDDRGEGPAGDVPAGRIRQRGDAQPAAERNRDQGRDRIYRGRDPPAGVSARFNASSSLGEDLRDRRDAMGKDCRGILRASFGLAQHDCPMGDLTEGGVPRSDVDGTLVRADGRIVPVSASWAFFEDEAAERLGFVISFRSIEEIERLAEERRGKFPLHDIVGKTPRIRQIFDMVDVVKDTDSTVLITGESGTGKGLFARAIHDLSPRREKPFVKVNCAALTETLLESELFGHVKGAFTGAIADKIGRFEAADGGTIFLDEIGEISPALQVKLLRVLQEREFERVGSSSTLRVDVRVIAATNRDLKAAMTEGRFRGDLFYRLNVIPILVPPLRERKEDIPLLVGHVLKRLKQRGMER